MEHPSSVMNGAASTALVVAALRAIETANSAPLFTDQFAARLVQAAHMPKPLPTHPDQVREENRVLFQLAVDSAALRTRYLDDYLTGSPAPQVVILAAGLDTRSFRLDWPPGCKVFELDRAPVMEFKQKALDEIGARASCDRRPVAVDLRDDWEAALLEAGFDPFRPTAWLIEGLLPYLPASAEEKLFDAVHRLSAAGSSIGVWALAQDTQSAGAPDRRLSAMYADFGIDITDMANTEPRRNIIEHLPSLAWKVEENTMDDLSKRYQRPLPSSRRRLTFFTAQNSF
ncbi:SAM-dependent methyltransferase [Streptomyces kronopolitis]|uniref:SAM-dependent methyltransferase n=1 Tax=Streptomyces kronopolitis TaxID=1612435 RepID=UPI003D96E9D7